MQPKNVVKLLTVIERAGNNAELEVVEKHFKHLAENKASKAISTILQRASVRLLDESIKNNEPTTGRQLGSLYDDVIFDTSVYIDGKSELVLNTSFGSQVDPNTPKSKSLKHASDVLLFLSQQL